MTSKRISITQRIIDNSNPWNGQNCYFYNVIKPLLKDGTDLVVLCSRFSINGKWYKLSRYSENFIHEGMSGIKVKPKRFRVMIPTEYLK